MKNEGLKKASGYIKNHKFQKRWQRIVVCFAAIVVFCTTYALILPAITMEEPSGEEAETVEEAEVVEETEVVEEAEVVEGEETAETEETPSVELTASDEGYTVSVCYDEEAGLPENVTLQTSEISQDSPEYLQYCQQGMEVTADLTDFPDQGEDSKNKVICFGQDEPELANESIHQEGEITGFTQVQDGFSAVDYYVCIDDQWVCVGTSQTGRYGDYSAAEQLDTSRDCITAEQAASVLGAYGFDVEGDLSYKTAYQQKSDDTIICSDANAVEIDGEKVLLLSRSENHLGYNLYYLPNNENELINITSPDDLDKVGNSFYTIKIYNADDELLESEEIPIGGNFTFENEEADGTEWLAVFGDGTEKELGSTIFLENITAPVMISPKPEKSKSEESRSVTFKVMVDGQWKTAGSLPYYFSGSVNGSQRAYITSAMAAQFFGDYGYTADTDPGYHFGYSYNDIYNILYAGNTGFAMDISDGIVQEQQKLQLGEWNEGDSQTFRIRETEEGCCIVPAANSRLYVSMPCVNSADDMPLVLSGEKDGGSIWFLQRESDGNVSFRMKNALDGACIAPDGGTTANGTELHIRNGMENSYWQLNQVYRISNKIVSWRNEDGTYNIGLTEESDGDIVCYYLPAEMQGTIENEPESAIEETNSFWSVSISEITDADGIPVLETGALSISCRLKVGGDQEAVDHEGFDFQIELLESEDGSSLKETFQYRSGDDNDTIPIKSGDTIHLKSGEEAVIEEIPAGTFYRVTEIPYESYRTTVNGEEGHIAGGMIQKDAEARADFVNTPYYMLPETGGRGTAWYTLGGLLLTGVSLLLLYREKKRRKEDSASS